MTPNYDPRFRGPGVGGPSSSSSDRYFFGVPGSSSSGYRPSFDGNRSSDGHRPGVGIGGPSSSSSRRPRLSFLFVVNRLLISAEDQHVPHVDRWGNSLPPYDRRSYVHEEPSRVMRYQGGRVTLAEGHVWHRPYGRHTPGYIVERSRSNESQPVPYKVRTAFSCNPFLPIISAPEDMTTRDMDEQHNSLRWDMLSFEHDQRRCPGISFAVCGQAGRQHVAGKNPSWIPSLVPDGYRSSYDVPDSRGLSGDLPLLLALMSFYPRWGKPHEERMHDVFYGPRAYWRDQEWRAEPDRRPAGYSRCEDTPHGLLVQVSLDNIHNREGSTVENMKAFERSVIVRDCR